MMWVWKQTQTPTTQYAWQQAAKDAHGIGKDAFDAHKAKCSSRWEKTKQGGIVKALEPLNGIENRGNGGN